MKLLFTIFILLIHLTCINSLMAQYAIDSLKFNNNEIFDKDSTYYKVKQSRASDVFEIDINHEKRRSSLIGRWKLDKGLTFDEYFIKSADTCLLLESANKQKLLFSQNKDSLLFDKEIIYNNYENKYEITCHLNSANNDSTQNYLSKFELVIDSKGKVLKLKGRISKNNLNIVTNCLTPYFPKTENFVIETIKDLIDVEIIFVKTL